MLTPITTGMPASFGQPLSSAIHQLSRLTPLFGYHPLADVAHKTQRWTIRPWGRNDAAHEVSRSSATDQRAPPSAE